MSEDSNRGRLLGAFGDALLRKLGVSPDAHAAFEARYRELEDARATLALQARQLRAANEIAALVHRELELDRALETVAHTLVAVAGFAGSELALAGESRCVRDGITDGEPLVDEPLHGRGRELGRLRLWAAERDGAGLRELFEAVRGPIAMALDNALIYRELADYRQNLEQKVAERTAELVEARDQLARTVKHLEDAQRARDRIFANVNHEIRTPLTLILLTVFALKQRHADDARAVGELQAIERAARGLLRLVDEVLLLARHAEKQSAPTMKPLDLAQLVRSVVGAWRAAAEASGLTLEHATPERFPLVGDVAGLERVLSNLLSNAVKFTPRGGSVLVRLSRGSGDRAWLDVRDTGVGVDDEVRRRIFGRFEQGRPSVNARSSGSGLGLSLVKEIVQAHGGTVSVDTPTGGGTVFRVVLPAKPLDGGDEVAEPPPLELGPVDFGVVAATEPSPTVFQPDHPVRFTVLIAEDDPQLGQAMARLLADEVRVLLARDGATALALARLEKPDLLISDVGLPGIDGIELTRRFRELDGNRLAPVLLVSAFAEVRDRLGGFDAGAIDYVVKPFHPDELRARVRSQLAFRELALKLHESEQLAAMGTLAAGLAHEMRNPANAIVNAVEPLLEKLPPELTRSETPVRQLLEVLRDCSSQVASLSKQLLDFRRAAPLELGEHPFSDVVSRALSRSRPALDGVELKLELGYVEKVRCAAPLISQALANLVENAAHAAGPGGWVRLASSTHEGRLVVVVADSGAGVPRELRERIFEPFFTTKPPGKGTGLGLTTAREIVRRHRGELDVRDWGDRSVFHVEIPLGAAP